MIELFDPIYIGQTQPDYIYGCGDDGALAIFTSPEAFNRYAAGYPEITSRVTLYCEGDLACVRDCWRKHGLKSGVIDPVDEGAPRIPLDQIRLVE